MALKDAVFPKNQLRNAVPEIEKIWKENERSWELRVGTGIHPSIVSSKMQFLGNIAEKIEREQEEAKEFGNHPSRHSL